ncbi:MAG TPA: hypothetical protein VGR91_13795 [Stellaceae bacterium]|nr:hypothetical protein [Stellaceae bacterium]
MEQITVYLILGLSSGVPNVVPGALAAPRGKRPDKAPFALDEETDALRNRHIDHFSGDGIGAGGSPAVGEDAAGVFELPDVVAEFSGAGVGARAISYLTYPA